MVYLLLYSETWDRWEQPPRRCEMDLDKRVFCHGPAHPFLLTLQEVLRCPTQPAERTKVEAKGSFPVREP